MLKLIFMINRAEGMSYERFVDHHRNRHAPLFTSIPEADRYVRGYTVSHPVPAGKYPPRAYDGMTEIWFENWEDHDAFFASENYRTLVNPDEARFIDMASVAVMVTEETKVIPAEGTFGGACCQFDRGDGSPGEVCWVSGETDSPPAPSSP